MLFKKSKSVPLAQSEEIITAAASPASPQTAEPVVAAVSIIPFTDGLVNAAFSEAQDIIPKVADSGNASFTALALCEVFHTCIVKVRYKPSYMRAKSSGRLLGGKL